MDSYIGQIRMFAGNFSPLHWAFCDGQILSVAQNQPLFSLLGSQYGGNGHTTFSLPEMRGRIPMHFGTGPSLSPRTIGSRFGQETVTLTETQIPSHNHPLQASTNTGDTTAPTGALLAATPQDFYTPDNSSTVNFDQNEVQTTGRGEPHTNMMPTQCVNFIICLQGIYPSRS